MPTERDQLELVFRADTSGVAQADKALDSHAAKVGKVATAHKQAAKTADDATKTFVAATNGIAEKTANAARNTVIFGTRAAQDALQGGLGAIANNIEQVGSTVASTFAGGFTKGLVALRAALFGPAGVIALLTLVAVKGEAIMAGLGKIADKLGLKPRNGVAEAMEDIKRRTQEAEDAVKSSVDRMRQALATEEGQESAGQIQQFFAWSNQQDPQAMAKLLESMRKQAIEATTDVTGKRAALEGTEAEIKRLEGVSRSATNTPGDRAAANHDLRILADKARQQRAELAAARADKDVQKAAEADVNNLISGADTADEQARLFAMVGRAGRPDLVNSLQARSIQAVQDERRFEEQRKRDEEAADLAKRRAEETRQNAAEQQAAADQDRMAHAERYAAAMQDEYDVSAARHQAPNRAGVMDSLRQAGVAEGLADSLADDVLKLLGERFKERLTKEALGNGGDLAGAMVGISEEAAGKEKRANEAAQREAEKPENEAKRQAEKAEREAIRDLEAQRRDAEIMVKRLQDPAFVNGLLSQARTPQEYQAMYMQLHQKYQDALATYGQSTDQLIQLTGHLVNGMDRFQQFSNFQGRRIEELFRMTSNMFNTAQGNMRSQLGRGMP
jgi:hypothetical protein